MQVPYTRELRPEVLASRKGVESDLRSEGSEPAKVGTNEQESDKRLFSLGKVAHHTKALKFR